MNQSYITIGEQNVSTVQKLLVCVDKYSSVDQELGSIAQNYKQAYNMHLVELVKTYPEAQQTTDPVIIENFQKLSQIVDLSKAQFNASPPSNNASSDRTSILYAVGHNGETNE